MPRSFLPSSLLTASAFACLAGYGVACSSTPTGAGPGGSAADGGTVVGDDDASPNAPSREGGSSPKDLEGWVPVTLPDGYAPYRVFYAGNQVWVGASRPEGTDQKRLVIGWVDSTLAFTRVGGPPEVVDTIGSVHVNSLVTAIAPFDGSRTVIAGNFFLDLIGAGATTAASDPVVHPYANSATAAGPSDVWVGSSSGSLYHVTPTGTDEHYAGISDLAGVWTHANVLYMYADDGLRRVSLPVAPGWNGASELEMPSEEPGSQIRTLVGNANAAFAVDRSNRTALRSKGSGWTPCPYGAEIPESTGGGEGFLAVAGYEDAWMVIEQEHLMHFDGKAWTEVSEPGAPTSFSQLATEPDGTLWATAILPGEDKATLFRRGVRAAH